MRLHHFSAALVSVVTLFTAASATRADFIDTFEGKTLDPFWSISSSSGSITFPSTTQHHSGSQSVQFNSTAEGIQKNILLTHNFDQAQYGDVSVWLYDTGADLSSGNYMRLFLNNKNLGVQAQITTYDYDLGPSNGGNYYVTPFGATDINSGIDRTQAWHQFEINSTSSSLIISVDGRTVFTGAGGTPFDEVGLHMYGPGFRPAFVSYFDDFTLTTAAVPEPGTLTLMGFGAVTLFGFTLVRSRNNNKG